MGPARSGWNLARELIKKGNEVTLIENNFRDRYLTVEQELEHSVQYGDASNCGSGEGGISRADMVIAVTGDDEDNILICQVAKEKYLVDRIVARINNPRNRAISSCSGSSRTSRRRT